MLDLVDVGAQAVGDRVESHRRGRQGRPGRRSPRGAGGLGPEGPAPSACCHCASALRADRFAPGLGALRSTQAANCRCATMPRHGRLSPTRASASLRYSLDRPSGAPGPPLVSVRAAWTSSEGRRRGPPTLQAANPPDRRRRAAVLRPAGPQNATCRGRDVVARLRPAVRGPRHGSSPRPSPSSCVSCGASRRAAFWPWRHRRHWVPSLSR